MNEGEYRNQMDELEIKQDAVNREINEQTRQVEEENYTYTGAYAERTYKDLKRAAKEARRSECAQRRAEYRRKGKKTGFIGRVAAVLLCGVLLSVCFI